VIVGAGLAGLIVSHMFPRHRIVEAAPEPIESHKALLRFRSDEIGKLTGIDFRPVRVRKAIFDGEKEVPPTIRLANLYTRKCLDRIEGERSIWDLEPVTRYVAPEDFYAMLVESAGSRISWNTSVDFADRTNLDPTISTAPLDVVCSQLGIDPGVAFERSPITVARFRVPRCDAFQTVYFPNHDTTLYRATITGNLLISEFAGAPEGQWYTQVMRAFGIGFDRAPQEIGETSQRYGKIAPIPEEIRKSLIAHLSVEHDIFSIGRFATWRNLLLDDILNDAVVVKKLMNSTHYDRRIIAS
jgi:hypothetical protein